MKKIFILAAGLALGMASCSKDVTPKEPEFGGATNVNFVLKTQESTRASQPGTTAENNVSVLEIYIFNPGGTVLDPKVGAEGANTQGYVSFTSPEFKAATGTDGRFRTQIEMSAGDSKDVLVVANASLGTPAAIVTALIAQDPTKYSSVTTANLTLAQIMELVVTKQLSNTNSREVPSTGIVMSGINLDADVIEAKDNNVVEIDIYRRVARIEAPIVNPNSPVTVSFDQKDYDKVFQPTLLPSDPSYVKIETIDLSKMAFNLTGYAVVSGLPKSTAGFVGNAAFINDPVIKSDYVTAGMEYENEWDLWKAGLWNEGVLTANSNTDEILRGARIMSNHKTLYDAGETITTASDLRKWTGVYSGVDTNDNDCILPIPAAGTKTPVYVYESKPGVMETVGFTGFNADQVIAVIVQGSLSYDGGAAQTRYWRVNVREQDAYHIIANASYQVQIDTIVTPGHSTPWEAEEEVPIIGMPGTTSGEFIVSIIPWDVRPVGSGNQI